MNDCKTENAYPIVKIYSLNYSNNKFLAQFLKDHVQNELKLLVYWSHEICIPKMQTIHQTSGLV